MPLANGPFEPTVAAESPTSHTDCEREAHRAMALALYAPPAAFCPRMSDDGFEREIRFAVVMYGGVSLAIYMNGIAQELLRMVRATAPADGDPLSGRFRWQPAELSGTERIYRELAGRLKARFVVDIISGTSAGGINGVFLAKALVRDRPLDRLRDLWVEEGDIGKLLNDKRSLQGGVPAELFSNPPPSLLNGHRFYWQLLDALEEMDKAPAHAAAMPAPQQSRRAPYVDEIDLYVTATDFQGVRLPLALFDKTIEEPLHRKLFHFRYFKPDEDAEEQDDFDRSSNPMLAFAARCTASFPAAFAPFKLEDIDAALESHPGYGAEAGRFDSASGRWAKFFAGYPPTYARRYFVDGGYLDNKPFEAALGALASRHHVLLPVERKLLYIEPDPERYARRAEDTAPDVVKALLAVSSLPRVETIRAEIDEITRRNRVYERASVLTLAVEEDAKKLGKDRRQAGAAAGPWALNDLGDLVATHGLAYGGYHRLKVARIVDWLAGCLFAGLSAENPAAGAGETRIDTVRTWVSGWRATKYRRYYDDSDRQAHWEPLRHALASAPAATEEEKVRRRDLIESARKNLPLMETRLLIDLDVAYRLRRIEFVRAKLGEIQRSEGEAAGILQLAEVARAPSPGAWEQARGGLVDLQKALRDEHQKLIALNRACLELDVEPPRPFPARVAPALAAFRRAPAAATAGALLDALADAVGPHLTRIGDECKTILTGGVDGPAPGSYLDHVRRALLHFYSHYDDFDLVGFPLLYCLGTEELAQVQVLRVSAADTELAGTRRAEKLAGVQLGHFGAFLDAGWREHDILWGRLDGAERIVAALTAGAAPGDGLDAKAWQYRAFASIVDDRKRELSGEGESEAPAPAQAAAPTAATIRAEVDRLTANAELPPAKTLDLLGRSTAIVRKLMGGVAEQRGLEKNVVVGWSLRLLLVVWGLVELAIPESLAQLLIRHWLQLIMLAGGLLAVVGHLLDRPGEQRIGVFAVLVAALVRLAADGLTGVASRRRPRTRPLWLAVAVGVGTALLLLAAPRARAGIAPYVMFDLEVAHDHERLAAVLATCGPACVSRLVAAIRWDFVVIAGYVLALAGLSLLNRTLLLKLGARGAAAVARKLALATVAAALADVAENVGLLTALGRQLWRPIAAMSRLDGVLAHLVPAMTFAFSALKWVLLACVVVGNALALVVGLGAAAVKRARAATVRA
jgi:patatin-related protein